MPECWSLVCSEGASSQQCRVSPFLYRVIYRHGFMFSSCEHVGVSKWKHEVAGCCITTRASSYYVIACTSLPPPCISLARTSSTTMVLLYTLIFAAAASAKCYEASIAHPLPDLDPNDPVLKHAFVAIDTAITSAIGAPKHASTSFSIEITSSKETLWSRHHTALERNASRPDIPRVNGDALYRIASITKTFTVLGILYQHEADNLSLDDSVDKYIPELKEDQNGTIPWKDITLRSLASQLSGIPRDCRKDEYNGCRSKQGTQAHFLQ
jgi:CubicO group peptidase (beta-lactamase class C family)